MTSARDDSIKELLERDLYKEYIQIASTHVERIKRANNIEIEMDERITLAEQIIFLPDDKMIYDKAAVHAAKEDLKKNYNDLDHKLNSLLFSLGKTKNPFKNALAYLQDRDGVKKIFAVIETEKNDFKSSVEKYSKIAPQLDETLTKYENKFLGEAKLERVKVAVKFDRGDEPKPTVNTKVETRLVTPRSGSSTAAFVRGMHGDNAAQVLSNTLNSTTRASLSATAPPPSSTSNSLSTTAPTAAKNKENITPAENKSAASGSTTVTAEVEQRSSFRPK